MLVIKAVVFLFLAMITSACSFLTGNLEIEDELNTYLAGSFISSINGWEIRNCISAKNITALTDIVIASKIDSTLSGKDCLVEVI